jgi:molybdopterin-biosynthesis enzyme MoeA-like protein
MTKAGGKQKDVASDTNSPAANIVESADLAVNSLGRAASMVANINNKFHVK